MPNRPSKQKRYIERQRVSIWTLGSRGEIMKNALECFSALRYINGYPKTKCVGLVIKEFPEIPNRTIRRYINNYIRKRNFLKKKNSQSKNLFRFIEFNKSGELGELSESSELAELSESSEISETQESSETSESSESSITSERVEVDSKTVKVKVIKTNWVCCDKCDTWSVVNSVWDPKKSFFCHMINKKCKLDDKKTVQIMEKENTSGETVFCNFCGKCIGEQTNPFDLNIPSKMCCADIGETCE